MNIKKLIATATISLSALMGGGVANALTNYDFNATLSNGWTMSAVYTADSSQATSQLYQGVTYTSTPFVSVSNFTLNGIAGYGVNPTLPANSYNSGYNYGYVSSSSASPSLSYFSQLLYQNNYSSNLAHSPNVETDYITVYSSAPLTTNGSSFYWPHHYTFTSTSAFGPSNSVSSAILFTSATWTPQSSPGGGVAPEMNTSFIPQVALMLACLFFLLGRKKENTEQMMTA